MGEEGSAAPDTDTSSIPLREFRSEESRLVFIGVATSCGVIFRIANIDSVNINPNTAKTIAQTIIIVVTIEKYFWFQLLSAM